ncbi:10745_t:CDS:2, partial [Dentiscutata erythropus]
VISIPTVSTFADNTLVSNVFTGSSETPDSPKINGGSSPRFTAIMNSHSALLYPINQYATSSTSPNKATNGMLNASAKSQYSVPAIQNKDLPNS